MAVPFLLFNTMENEEWREIPQFEGLYEVSCLGRIRSIRHLVVFSNGTKRMMGGIIIKPMFSHAGYHQVNLYRDRKCITTKVHRAVAAAFIPNPIGYEQVNHLDFSRTNNCVQNLEWCSAGQNTNHLIEAGRLIRGKNKPLAKLTDEDVLKIRELHKAEMKQVRCKRGFVAELANRFGVSKSAITQVVSKASWKHI
jgi:hypothetical protein